MVNYLLTERIRCDVVGSNTSHNSEYHDMLTAGKIKGYIFGIDDTGLFIKMRINSSHRIVAVSVPTAIAEVGDITILLEEALCSYLKQRNGDSFVLVHPQKEDLFKRIVENKGYKANLVELRNYN